jgi:lipopolysaccharide transport system ATP-binding protein
MSDTVIEVENLSKKYIIGHQKQERYTALRDVIADGAKAFWRSLFGGGSGSPENKEEFWALKDVSFEVKQGECIGIIGRNGAGKSTLLKILSRITEPTTGRIKIRGRVASLLEVGTGFHPELTGRENIFLNGSILGMSRAEIKAKFDEIVDFAEVERFLDTPVKFYSSGMYVRLAFAVAAHLEPEILVVDEVLAVGDAAFQKKCLGKMGDVAEKEGRTVLFVSHNLASLANLCNQGILLVQGEKQAEGACNKVIEQYISTGKEASGEIVWSNLKSSPGNEHVRLHKVRIICNGGVTDDVAINQEISVEVFFWNLKSNLELSTSIHLLDKMGVCVLASANFHSANLLIDEWFGKPYPTGLYKVVCKIPSNFLNEGMYSINVIVISGLFGDVFNTEARVDEVLSFNVHEMGGMRRDYAGQWIGVVRPKLAWQTEFLTSDTQENNLVETI